MELKVLDIGNLANLLLFLHKSKLMLLCILEILMFHTIAKYNYQWTVPLAPPTCNISVLCSPDKQTAKMAGNGMYKLGEKALCRINNCYKWWGMLQKSNIMIKTYIYCCDKYYNNFLTFSLSINTSWCRKIRKILTNFTLYNVCVCNS